MTGAIAIDFRSFDNDRCPRCGEIRTGGSHYHCGNCGSKEETSMLGHYYKDFVHGQSVGEPYFHCKGAE